VNFILRKLVKNLKPNQEIIVEDTKITMGFKSPVKSMMLEYKLNEEVVVDTDNGKFNATLTFEDGKLIVRQTPLPGNNSKHPVESVRQINSDGELEVVSYQLDCDIFTPLNKKTSCTIFFLFAFNSLTTSSSNHADNNISVDYQQPYHLASQHDRYE